MLTEIFYYPTEKLILLANIEPLLTLHFLLELIRKKEPL